MKPFLDCNIWSVGHISDDMGFSLVQKIYPYYSDTEEFNFSIEPGFIQIPEFEITNLHLLDNLDYTIINQFRVPILKRTETGIWTIDLTHYENLNIQS
jgi:hypothetical protein